MKTLMFLVVTNNLHIIINNKKIVDKTIKYSIVRFFWKNILVRILDVNLCIFFTTYLLFISLVPAVYNILYQTQSITKTIHYIHKYVW